VLENGDVQVLIYNTQTEGPVPAQLRKAAEASKIPVVEVTETVKSGTKGFADWQAGQLNALLVALR
jgi:zinc/manganese transport system substrate-binding protein